MTEELIFMTSNAEKTGNVMPLCIRYVMVVSVN